MCKHFSRMPEESCSLCTPPPPLKKIDHELEDLRKQYATREEFLKNFDVLWVEDEIATVYLQVVLEPVQNKRKLIYQTALDLGRTLGAVEWVYRRLTEPEKDLHRGEATLRFMLENSLFRPESPDMPYVMLKDVKQHGLATIKTNTRGIDPTQVDGETVYEVVGYADTYQEAEFKLKEFKLQCV